jgi:tRNA (guanine-N7-)-methyltransferase
VGKDKLKRFAENVGFRNLMQPSFDELYNKEFCLKGKWGREFFCNPEPIKLELGCGRGEYTIGMAQADPLSNHIGIDIKGARLWRGAKTATEESLSNAAFVRTNIELLGSIFEKNEISEIWITFPDPQLKERRIKKRLTGSRMLNLYSNFLSADGTVNLKTDSAELHSYTKELLEYNGIVPLFSHSDIYSGIEIPEILNIKTHYEQIFLKQGKSITYLKFRLPGKEIVELPS